MVALYGAEHSRRELASRAGMLSQFAGVRLVTLGDGVERGIRMLEFRTGTGLRFTVLVDRALDIADCEYRGAAIGWHSPAGFRHPGLHEYEGEGGLAWLRSFSGLVVTCGLDHILFMHSQEAGHYHYVHRRTVDSSIHGRVSTIPARLTGYGERWNGDECTLFCEGVVQQSTVFGEDLHLIRRIEVKVGGDEIRLLDRVVNHGFYRTPHMFCYHINIGHPVLAEGSRYLAPVEHVAWASHAETYQAQGVGYHTMPGPRAPFHEQVWEHGLAADADGLVPVALVNDAFDGGRGLGFLVETRKDQFPCQFQWQNFQAGQYAMGIEPATNHVLGKPFAQERGELIWLEHGEERRYDTRFAVLDGAEAIGAAERRIRAIAAQPDEDYPPPSGRWDRVASAMEFTGRTVLFTGAAGGLGADGALAYMRAGARVLCIDIDEAKVAALEARAREVGSGSLAVERLDLADLAGLEAGLAALVAREGRIDIVVNNAAIYPARPFEDFTLADYQAVQRVNVEAGVLCVRAALPGMREQGWGRIVNVASVTVYGGWARLSPYVASKATLVGLTRAWAREFGPYGVTVNAVAPGAFPTDAEKIHPDPEGYTRFVLDHQAVQRRGRPDDIAQALLFLTSDRAGFITGQTLNVDGGWVMH